MCGSWIINQIVEYVFLVGRLIESDQSMQETSSHRSSKVIDAVRQTLNDEAVSKYFRIMFALFVLSNLEEACH